MKIITIGCGYIGSVIARDLTEQLSSAEVIISDNDMEKTRAIAAAIGKESVHPMQLDVSDPKQLVKMLEGFDLAVGLTPGRVGYAAVDASIQAGVDIVDLSYMPQDPLTLNEKALRSQVAVIPDCGVAPGLSNILVGRAVTMLDKVRDVKIFVGGLPNHPIPPLDYKITWCVEDLVEEYLRVARIVKDGQTTDVKALNGLEEFIFPGVGRLEAFYTDGVRTLHHTVKGVENMWEKTMRYPGHVQKIKLLMELGFFDTTPLEIEDVRVAPCEVTTKLLEQRLSLPEIGDLLAMSIEVIGTEGSSEITHTYNILDHYDANTGITAMGRTTAYTASIVTQLLARGVIQEKGVIPPEKLGMNEELFEIIMADLKQRGINILYRKK